MDVDPVLLGSTADSPSFGSPLEVVPELGYTSGLPAFAAPDLLAALEAACRRRFGGRPDLWYFHNPTLGKNGRLLEVVQHLAARGDPLLLHVHDFAEDGRPENLAYRRQTNPHPARSLPVRPGIVWATLTARDAAHLVAAGVPAAAIRILGNPVEAPPSEVRATRPPEATGRPFYLSPVRALRRKNPGELLLLAAIDASRGWFATSLGPTNPAYLPTFHHWQALAASTGLPVAFGINEAGDFAFEELVAGCDAVVTTAIAEGFGLGFLEPWLRQRPVIGRDLPNLTAEFRQEGIALPSLYPRIDVPSGWLDRTELARRHRAAVQRLGELYQIHWDGEEIDTFTEEWLASAGSDFANLDEDLQSIVIRRAVHEPEAFATTAFPPPAPAPEILQQNRAAVSRTAAPSAYAARVATACRTAVEAPQGVPPQWADSEALLHRFLNPSGLSLLRC